LRTTVEQLPDVQKRRYVIDEIIADVKGCAWKGKPLPEPPVHLIPLANGVFDLETNELRPYQPGDYFTWKLPWRYNPKAESKLVIPLIESFLPEDQTITLYELMAYCLWRGYPYQKLFILYGRGSNGKSLFARILERLLGKENVAHVSLNELQHGRFAGASLYGKLANAVGELEYSEIQKTGLLKQLTGEDTIEADRKFREPIKFRNYAKLIFLTNEVPRSADTTEAFYRRLFLIEFPKQFKENPALEVQVVNADPEEYEALLYGVLQTLQDLRKRNFIFTHHRPTEEVQELYLKLSSPLHSFVEECCEITYNGDDYIFKWKFKEHFTQWLQQKGRTAYSDSRIKQEMLAMGLDEAKRGPAEKRWWAWVGIKWKEEQPTDGDEDAFTSESVQGVQSVHGFTTDYKQAENGLKSVDTLDTLDTSPTQPNLEQPELLPPPNLSTTEEPIRTNIEQNPNRNPLNTGEEPIDPSCPVCNHPQRKTIEYLLDCGLSPKYLSRKYNVPIAAIYEHERKHIAVESEVI
jgi:putative DNA primase/helicase